MKKILYLTDLYYEAKGRRYYEEDLYITGRLKDYFDIVLCHLQNSESFEKDVDLIVFRNTGAINGFKDLYFPFLDRVKTNGFRTFNEFTGKGDMKGKQYLVDLTKVGYPVVPTIDTKKELGMLGEVKNYVIKPKIGADSIGLEYLTKDELMERELVDGDTLIQPAIDLEYEVSFCFLNDKFEYAMYAPDNAQRWKLEKYPYSDEDIEFARKFIEWNGIKNGIQRIDACRTKDGKLLLMELEDMNPYLSVLELDDETRETFIKDLITALTDMVE